MITMVVRIDLDKAYLMVLSKDHLYKSHNSPLSKANIQVLLLFKTVQSQTELKYPYFVLKSRCIMGY